MSDTLNSDLHKPLTGKPTLVPKSQVLPHVARGLAAVGLAVLAGVGLYAALVDNPRGGDPAAVAKIEARKSVTPSSVPETLAQPQAQPAPAGNRITALESEAQSGVTVVRPGAEAPGAVMIRVPDRQTVKLAPAPDRRISERTQLGVLPKLGEDGARALEIYARPFAPPAALANAPRIAVLVGGLGISQNATADALAKLPTQISLAFAPYGTEIDRAVTRARSNGHEVFLQVPMEPFDYPDNDPGPHTLLTGPKASENLERLRWVLARFPGYVGVVNYQGGRLMSDEAALKPVVDEIAGRGLMVVDDGSASRSLLMPAAAAKTVSLKANFVLDASTRPEAIDRELAKLELLARERGHALATATVLPVTVERLARWARTLEARGLLLVPVTALPRQPATTGSIR